MLFLSLTCACHHCCIVAKLQQQCRQAQRLLARSTPFQWNCMIATLRFAYTIPLTLRFTGPRGSKAPLSARAVEIPKFIIQVLSPEPSHLSLPGGYFRGGGTYMAPLYMDTPLYERVLYLRFFSCF